ncbi:hypothetical protein JQS43_10665 [Natronosporangium hydrolyticum]|uniref:DUF3368 domain-containing protein n=1 Tax=Natronosporangium hydrolyticum TaxID=2811111 RepID=A0A895YL40_9ACTN|nr:hypothetical protein [Natronosporangium hydrolyticum]QSB16695.1 hypothetical protein JQS43_10665 [Natronosporangium hydrolyticum]
MSVIPLGSSQLLIFDTMILSHFALADRLDVLGELLLGQPCATTTVVLDELRTGAKTRPELAGALELEWVRQLPLDRPGEIKSFGVWVRRLGATGRDLGEASVFAAAEHNGAVAITDDRSATRVGRAYRLSVHGTIWLLVRACGAGKLTEAAAGTLVEALRATGHRLPCTGTEFPRYVRQHGLL